LRMIQNCHPARVVADVSRSSRPREYNHSANEREALRIRAR
jgi:hypothetical protein